MINDHDLDDPAAGIVRCFWCGLPGLSRVRSGLSIWGCDRCFPRNTPPTRDSMVQQAVVTAAGNRYPCAVREHRLAGALSFLTVGGHMPVHDQLLDDIRAEFHKIAARYA